MTTGIGDWSLGPLSLALVSAAILSYEIAWGDGDVDWSKHLLDGVQLTGNWNVRYLNADAAVGATVRGKTQEEADLLVNGQYSERGEGRPSLSWPAGETAEIDLDLRADRLLSGVIVERKGEASSWEMAASMDRRTWREIPQERMSSLGSSWMAANLALPARYVRVHATAGAEGLSINELFIYGEREADVPALGGIYPSSFPPVAGEGIELRAVIRNTGRELVRNAKVEFRQLGPKERVLGETRLNEATPGSAKLASIPWKPQETEPHEIEVTLFGEGIEPSKAAEVIPVVNRRLYFSNFFVIDNDRLKYANLYTTIGGGFEYFLAKLRGRLGLYHCTGVCGHVQDLSFERLYSDWSRWVGGPYRDGINMDEWAARFISYEVREALKRTSEQHEGRLIAPWLIGRCDETIADAFQ